MYSAGSDLFMFGPSVVVQQLGRLLGNQPEVPDMAFRDEPLPRRCGVVVFGSVEEALAEVREDESAPRRGVVRQASVLRTPSSVRYWVTASRMNMGPFEAGSGERGGEVVGFEVDRGEGGVGRQLAVGLGAGKECRLRNLPTGDGRSVAG